MNSATSRHCVTFSHALCAIVWLLTFSLSFGVCAQPRQQLNSDACVQPHHSFECTVDALWQKTLLWLNAWADHDTEQYFTFYAPQQSPIADLTYPQWRQQREQRVGRQTPLKLGVNFLDAEAIEGRKVRILFIQRYDSGRYRDIVLKTLVYQLIDGHFYIVEEIAHQTLSEQDAQTILDNLK